MTASEQPVLIAFDGSAAARQAVAAAASLLAPHRVIVVTVWEEGLAYATPVPAVDMAPMASTIDPETALELDHLQHDHADRIANEGADLARSLGMDAQPLAVPEAANVAETILDLAREQNAVAIVVGSRGLSGLRARLEGSTSKAVSKRAACPVIVVHDTEAEPR